MNRSLPWERNIDSLQLTMVRILEEIYGIRKIAEI
jgi:hypothetical protein